MKRGARLTRLLRLGSHAAMVIASVALGACTTTLAPRSFDSSTHLRQTIAERAGADTAAGVLLPFDLDAEIVAELGERLSPAGSERRRVDQIVDYIFGFLDLQYTLSPTRSAVEAYRVRQGNCLSFVNLFVGVAREQRLNPFYVEVEDYQRWNFDHGTVVSHGHIVAGLRIDGELSTFDFLPFKAKSYRDFNPIDDLKATAHFYNNLGAEALLAGDLDRAQELITVAVELAPGFDKALNNLGVVLLREGETEEAIALYRRGLEIAPTDPALLTNLARAYQELGRLGEAEAVLAQLEGVEHSNPFFFVYRGDLALAGGDTEKALDQMREAYRRGSDIPEVHLGLVRVYLAMGDRQRALHHVERALQLDATHGEARKYAAMLLGPSAAGAQQE